MIYVKKKKEITTLRENIKKENISNEIEKTILKEKDIFLDKNNEKILDENYDSIINDDDSCVVCYSNPSNVVIMNCGHSDICDECAKDIWKSNSLCYLCQVPIEYIVVVEQVEENVFKVLHCIYLDKKDVKK